MSGAFSITDLVQTLHTYTQLYVIIPFEGTRTEGTRYFLNQIEKLNLIANP